jgi:GT2 family glycosyltransferase
VHVVVPYWGPAELLDATVASVRAQSDPSWTLTIVDDDYPDPAAADAYAHDPDPRVSYVRNEENLGLPGNFEKCRQLASRRDPRDLCVFVGCDDLLEPNFVARVREVHAAFPTAGVVQPGVRVVDATGKPVGGLAEWVKARLTPNAQAPRQLEGEALATSLMHGNWLYWPSIVFRVEVLRDKVFRQDLPILLDLALVMDLVLAGEKFVLDPVTSFTYRRHAASESAISRYDGRRFAEEARFHAEMAERLDGRGWRRARRAARLRATSRLHALALVPGALRSRSWGQVWLLLRHASRG